MMKKHILYFTKYSKLGASSRLRSFQFIPHLENEGFKVDVSVLFGNQYLKALYSGKKILFIIVLSAYIKRFFSLFNAYRYDLVIIEKELFPYFPAWFELLLARGGVKYFVDYDDAIFHNYDLSNSKFVRSCLGTKIDTVMRASSCVFAGNSYLYNRARRSGARRVVRLPTVIDIEKYYVGQADNTNRFIVGWIGSPSTFMYVERLFPVFRALRDCYPNFEVNIIGAKKEKSCLEGFINFVPWSEASEVTEINRVHVGIMPLADSPWELGKCSYKLIQYMGCGKAVLASPVGMNGDVVQSGVNGYLVNNDEWFERIEFYIKNKNMISVHGMNGRSLVETHYNVNTNLRHLVREIEC